MGTCNCITILYNLLYTNNAGKETMPPIIIKGSIKKMLFENPAKPVLLF